jgi:hypothetical protein
MTTPRKNYCYEAVEEEAKTHRWVAASEKKMIVSRRFVRYRNQVLK